MGTYDSPLKPEEWVDAHGDVLFRFAMTRLHDAALAEEAVQETFFAAWRSRASYGGRASERTWLTGILKHKIVDQMRTRTREAPLRTEAGQNETLDDLFDNLGHAKEPAQPWRGDARADLERKEFWERLQMCLGKLPERLRDVFVLRELDGLSSKDICKELGVTSTNYWVMLHRARLGLRSCLERNWFVRGEGSQT